MPEFKSHIRATFEPTDTKLLTNTPTSRLLTESPKLSTALSQIFPYLLLIDNLLEILTWTNEDHYQNFVDMLFLYNRVLELGKPCHFAYIDDTCILQYSVVHFFNNL